MIELRGRYPDIGRVVNEKCKEIVFVIKGSGKLNIEGVEIKLNKGDVVFIEPNEKYYFEGNLIMLTPCSPAWYPEQHKEVK